MAIFQHYKMIYKNLLRIIEDQIGHYRIFTVKTLIFLLRAERKNTVSLDGIQL